MISIPEHHLEFIRQSNAMQNHAKTNIMQMINNPKSHETKKNLYIRRKSINPKWREKKNGKWKITNWMNSPLEKEQERKKGKNLPFKSFVNWDRVDMIARRFVYCEWDDDDVNVDCNSFSTQFFYFSHTHAHAHTPIHGIRFATFILCILLFSVYFFSLSFFLPLQNNTNIPWCLCASNEILCSKFQFWI